VIEARTRRATWPVELRARLSAAAGAAITDVSKILAVWPAPDSGDTRAPTQFTGTAQLANGDLRISPVLDLLLELGFSYGVGPVSVSHSLVLGALSVNDMVSRQRAATALNGSGLALGVGLRLGGNR
jgi:hypothetical protein